MRCIITFLLTFFSFSCFAQEKNVTGTYVRYDKGNVAEIMVLRANGVFVATEFTPHDQIRNVEKGYWKISGDSIRFTFDQVIASTDLVKWNSAKSDKLKPVSFPVHVTDGGDLAVGSSTYKREKNFQSEQ